MKLKLILISILVLRCSYLLTDMLPFWTQYAGPHSEKIRLRLVKNGHDFPIYDMMLSLNELSPIDTLSQGLTKTHKEIR